MQQGGSILGNIGGLAGDVAGTVRDYTPAGALRQMISPQGAGLAALAGLGGALAIHGYHQWKAGALPFDERGSWGTPGNQEQPPVAGAPSWANTEYRRGLYPDRVARVWQAQNPAEVAAALTKHDEQYDTVVPKHLLAMQNQIGQLGDQLVQQVPAHQGMDPTQAAAWSLSQLDTAYHRGLIDSPAFNADYERFLTRAHTFGEEQPLFQQAALALSKELAWTYTPDLALPPSLDLVGMRFGPNGVETTVGLRRGSLPHDVNGNLWARERSLNYEAAIPMFVQNKLHIINNAEDITAPYAESQPRRADAGERQGDPEWYFKAHEFALDLAKQSNLDPWEVAPAVVAAMSPRVNWSDNQAAARQLVADYTKAKDAQGGSVAEPFLPRNSKGGFPTSVTKSYAGILPENLSKAESILTGQYTPDEILQSMKVLNFYRNLKNPWQPFGVTVDTLNKDGAFGYRSGDQNASIFESGNRGYRAYESLATADRVVARYMGYPTASGAQASAWTPVSYIANRGLATDAYDLHAPADLRTVVLGWGNPGPGFLADQAAPYSAAGDRIAPDFHTVSRDPFSGRKYTQDHLAGHAAYVTALPDGSFVIYGRAGDNVRPVLRALRPVGQADPVRRFIPVVPRPVESADQLRTSLEPVGSGVPAASRVEVHNDSIFGTHSAMVPQNFFHYSVDGQDEARLGGVQAAVKGLVPDAQISKAMPHQVYEAEAPLRHLTRDDLEGMGPQVFASDQSPLNKLQWVGLSAEKASLGKQDNYARHRALGAEIRKRGYEPIETEGVWGNNDGSVTNERSYLVFGMPNQEAIDLSRQFDQEGVATRTGLYDYASHTHMPATGEPVNFEIPGRKGKPKFTSDYGVIRLNGQEVRYQAPYDFDHPTDTVSPNDAHVPTAKTRQELRVNLGPVVSPQTVQALADLGREHGVGMKTYLHGDVLKPNGFAPVAEHVFTDNAHTVIHQGTSLQDEDPNAVEAYLPEGDALGVHQGRHPLLDSARTGTADDLGDKVVNNELRVVTPGVELGHDVLTAQLNGERQNRFALYVPDAIPGQTVDMPELAVGDDAQGQLHDKPTNRIVGIEVKGKTAKLRVPQVNGQPDMVLFNVAREYLARHGVKVGENALLPAEEVA